MTEDIYWSDTFLSKDSGLPTVALTKRCNKGLVVAYYNLNQLNDFISITMSDKEDFIAVLDARGNIIALTGFVNTEVAGNLNNMLSIKAAREGKYGIMEDYYKETKGITNVKRSKDNGFILLVFKSYNGIFRNIYKYYIIFLIMLSMVIIFFVLIILSFFRTFLKPLSDFQNTSRQVASGSYNKLPESKFIEFELLNKNFVMMIDKIKKREAALKTSIDEREMLLSELNHRTKNNMQLITGFMKLYYLKNPEADPLGLMKKIESKIETISLVHEKLYRSSDLSKINFSEYVEDLIPVLINSLSDSSIQIGFNIDIEETYLLLDYAVPCGLILNEFIINSLKYAFIDSDSGLIEVKSRITDNNRLEISYSDNGVGLPDSFDPSDNDSLGFSIINSIVKTQLRGDIKILNTDGFSCTFSFNLDTYTKRI